jgi:hypothetical protein
MEWFDRYSRRIEDSALPKGKAERERYLQTVGEDGFVILDALDALNNEPMRELPKVAVLRRTWQRHDDRLPQEGGKVVVRLRPKQELPRADEGIESPYDTAARYRHSLTWWRKPGRVLAGCGYCAETPSDPSASYHSAGDQVSNRVCNLSLDSPCLLADIPTPRM